MKFDDRFTTWYICEPCGTRHADEYDAGKCCPPEIEELYICNVCAEEFSYGREAVKHLAKSCKSTDNLSLHERYIEEVLMEERPCLGEWSYEYAVQNDLEIV